MPPRFWESQVLLTTSHVTSAREKKDIGKKLTMKESFVLSIVFNILGCITIVLKILEN